MTVSYYIAAAAAVAAAVPFAAVGYAVRRPLPERAARAVVFGATAAFALVYWALGMLKYRADLFGLWDFGIYDSMLHIAAQGGGLLRDVMAGDMPYIFVKHIYACASLVGAVICGVLRQPAGEMTAMLAGAAAVFAIRCLSAHYRWNLPHPNA